MPAEEINTRKIISRLERERWINVRTPRTHALCLFGQRCSRKDRGTALNIHTIGC